MQEIFGHALNITSFVFVMMLVMEYVNVQSSGAWQRKLARHRWSQYLLAGLLGATPGCLGAFMVVGLYAHRLIGLGAVVTAMVATSGDEAFVLFAMMPTKGLVLTAGLLGIGLLAGVLTDVFAGKSAVACDGLHVHQERECVCVQHGKILRQLREMSPVRGLLLIGLGVFIGSIAVGLVGPGKWNWVRVTLFSLSLISLGIVVTAPEHFLVEHLWGHVVKKHLPRIFLWTFGALILMHLLTGYLQIDELIRDSPWTMLLIAALVGLIPESGPHLVFLTLYVEGTIPLSVLVASSIVQDGHGMLPMLAHSRRAFVQIKAINLVVGLIVGAIGLWFGG